MKYSGELAYSRIFVVAAVGFTPIATEQVVSECSLTMAVLAVSAGGQCAGRSVAALVIALAVELGDVKRHGVYPA